MSVRAAGIAIYRGFNMAQSAAERKRKERERKAELGLVRRDVWAHPGDWPEIRTLEEKLKKKREKANK